MDLRQAARLNDIKCVESLLRDGVDVNAMNICNQTALYYTCFHGHEQLTELLLSAGADSNIGAKPLNAAIANYRNKCVDILLRNGANINSTSCTEKSALFVAFERRNYTAAELLVDNGADVNFCYNSGQDHNIYVSDILFRNAGRKQMKLVKKMLEKGMMLTVENNNVKAASRYAFNFGILDFAQSLLSIESNNNIQEHYSFALSSSALYNWLDVAKMLLNIGVKINSIHDDHTALQMASGAGHERMVELLLMHGADVNVCGESSRSKQKHLVNGDTAIHGRQLKPGSNSALHLAFANGNIAICEMLISNGADIDCLNNETMTLLHVAASLCDIDRVKWLIEKHKVNTICCDRLNRSALHFVCDCATADNSQCLAVVKILLDNGTLIDIVSAENETPLYLATKRGRVDVVRTLLAAGAKSHIAGSLNPLTEASQQGNIELVRLLLENCQISSTMPLVVAIQQRHCNIIELLLNSGAAVDEVMDNGQLPVGAFLMSLANLAQEDYGLPAPKRAMCDTYDKLWVLFETLVEKMDDINILDGLGSTPLHTACSLGLVNAANIILKNGADADMLTLFEVTPLHQACCDGKAEIVRLLLHHVDLTQLDFRALMTAAVSNGSARSLDVVICLLSCQGIDVSCLNTFSNNSQTLLSASAAKVSDPVQMVRLLEAACAHGRLDIVEVLLNAGVCPVECHYLCRALFITCKNNQVKILQLLLNHGVSPNCMRLDDRDSALCIACKMGFVQIADVLMKAGANVSFVTFRIAVVNNQADILALLLKNCDVVNAELEAPVLLFDSLSNPPKIQMLKLLLTTYGTCVNISYPLFGETPLHCAIKLHHLHRSGFETAIRILLAASPDKNIVDLDGKTALCLAVELGLPTSIIELLITKGAEPTTGLFPSLSIGNLEVTELLVTHGARLLHTDKNQWSALHHLLHNFRPTEKSTRRTPAICQKSATSVTSLATLFLSNGADPNLRSIVGVSPFHLACRCNDPDLVECLLKHGADVDQCLSPLRPLAVACQKTHLVVLQLLLNKGANPNIESTNVADMLPEKFMSYLSNILGDLVDHFTSILPLCIAAMLGESEVVQLLLKHGAYVNAIDDGIQMTALHAAVACVKSPAEFAIHHEVITLLLSSRADVNALDKNGRTALYHAALNGREDVVTLLTSHGADPNVASANMFPLCAACAGNHVSIVRLLLESGGDANPKQQPPDRLSSCVPTLPLGSAAYAGHPELIKLLLHSGADVIGIDRNGWTALLRASENFRCIALAHSHTLPGAVVLPDVPVIRSALACIVQLLDAGADANVSDPLGQTAIGHILSLLLDPFFFRLRYTAFCQAINEAVAQLMDHGSAISELHPHREEPEQNITLKNFMFTDTRCCQFATKLFKAGAGLRFVSAYLKAMSAESSPASDMLCRAVVLSGYKVTEADLSDFLSIRDVDNADEHALLAVESFERWLNDFQKKPPSLMMQCRIVVRQQLSAAHNFCDITASVSSLVLPKTLNQYLMFEGPMSEVDLSMVTDAVAMDSSE